MWSECFDQEAAECQFVGLGERFWRLVGVVFALMFGAALAAAVEIGDGLGEGRRFGTGRGG